MFTSRHIKEWLEDRVDNRVKVYNDAIPPYGRVIYVRMSPGPGYSMEGIQDNLGFTIEIRGADRNFDDAEELSRTVDDLILREGTTPWEFPDSEYMYFMARTGGPPIELSVADSAGRYAFTCNYYVRVATNL